MRLGRSTGPEEPQRVPRKDRRGASPFAVGALALLVIALATYLDFAKHIPFTHGFRVRAVFESANSIRPNSPVRIAGVHVGTVKAIAREPGTNAAVVTMEIGDKGLPIHKDATVRIRPRIFLEGNFFVDLQPGTPAAPTIDDGDTLPVSQTAAPVQLDQVLTALQQDTRSDLQRLVKSLATALTYKPSRASDAGADPLARGESAAESLNDSIRYGRAALRGTAEVTDALTGTRPHDLSRLIRGLQRTTEGLSRDEGSLQELVRNLDTTLAATASEAQSLGLTVRRLPATLAAADGALDSLNAAFPDTRAFAREIRPGVRETGPTIDAGFPWVAQARALLGPDELQGLVRELSPATGDLARVVDAGVGLFPQADLAAKCLTRVVLPTGNVKIQDGPLSTGVENFKEFWYAMVGLAGEGQNVDGNGTYVRFQPGGGDQTVSLGPAGGSAGDRLFGNAVIKPLGTRPRFPGRRPPYRPDVACFTNKLPDLDAAAFGPADGATP